MNGSRIALNPEPKTVRGGFRLGGIPYGFPVGQASDFPSASQGCAPPGRHGNACVFRRLVRTVNQRLRQHEGPESRGSVGGFAMCRKCEGGGKVRANGRHKRATRRTRYRHKYQGPGTTQEHEERIRKTRARREKRERRKPRDSGEREQKSRDEGHQGNDETEQEEPGKGSRTSKKTRTRRAGGQRKARSEKPGDKSETAGRERTRRRAGEAARRARAESARQPTNAAQPATRRALGPRVTEYSRLDIHQSHLGVTGPGGP